MREKDDLDLLLNSALSTYADPGAHSGLEGRVLAALKAYSSPERLRRRWWLPWAIGIPVAVCLLMWIVTAGIRHSTSSRTEQAHESQRAETPLAGGTIAGGPRVRTGHKIRASGAKALSDSAAFTARLKSFPVTKPSAGGALSPCVDSRLATKPDRGGDSSHHADSCSATEPDLSIATNGGNRTPLPKLDVFPTPQPLTAQERALAVVATQTPLPLRQALAQAQTEDDVPLSIAAIHVPPLEPPDQGQN